MVKTAGLRYVAQRGNPNDGVCIVGEAPGADEDRLGLPFVGASGKELGRICKDSGWPGRMEQIEPGAWLYCPSEVWHTNVFKLRPPDNKIGRIEEYGIPSNIFIEAFLEELRQYKPTIIVATGNTPLGHLCPFTRGKDGQARIGSFRGSLLTSSLLDWPHFVIPCYHPAFILRAWEERPIAVFCLERAFEEWSFFKANGKLNPLPIRNVILQPDIDKLIEILTDILTERKRVSVDLEMYQGMPVVYGLAWSAYDAVSFVLTEYTDDQCVRILRLLNEILRTCRQIGQNCVSYDVTQEELLSLQPGLQLIDDTLVMHHVLWPEFPHKLEFITMQYTREPYYKDEGRKWKPKDGIRKLLHYNALDTTTTYESVERMEAELEVRSGRPRL